jgi:hypothetical protein
MFDAPLPPPESSERSLARLKDRIKEALRQSSFEVLPHGPQLSATIPSPTERVGNWARGQAERLWGADRYGQQNIDSMARGLAQLFVLPSLADTVFHSSRGEPGNTILAAAGGVPGVGPLTRKGGKFAMEEVSRAASARPIDAVSQSADVVGTNGARLWVPPRSGLFDYSDLSKVPNVAQLDLPRYIPPRGIPQRTLDVTNDRGVRDKMLEVISAGRALGGETWFNTQPLRQKFVEELGEELGNAAFRDYIHFVAAASPRSEVGQSVRNGSYYYGRNMRGEGMPAVGDHNPYPYGHFAQVFHQINAGRVAGAGWDPLRNPKASSFAENLLGNYAPVTVDMHAFKLPAILAQDPRFLQTAFRVNKEAPKQNIQAMVLSKELPMNEALRHPTWWQAQPRSNEYGAWEQYYKGLAREAGLLPAQAQAAAWQGGGKITGLASDNSKPFIRFVEDRINLTAEKTGMDPKDVRARFIRGEMPLLSMGGGALTLGAIGQQQHEPHQ